jgi:anaerobic selenocysteine-containing dehydrogenase
MSSAVTENRRTARTFCRLCNAACGAVVTLEGERVVEVRGDREHPISQGYLCPKGRAIGAHHHHPGRLNRPLLGRDGGRVPVPWNEMLDDLAGAIGSTIAKTGPQAFGMYKGTAHTVESAAAGAGAAMLAQLGSRQWYTSLTVDCPALCLVAELVAGHPWLLPVPDRDTRLTVLVGTNPMASHGHTFNIPRPKEWLRSWAREGELWVIDPRRTESADVATVHLAPRPGTDYLLMAYLVRELLRDGADHAYLERHATGVGALAAAVEPFTLERAADGTGIPTDQIVRLLRKIRETGRVSMVTGTGLNFSDAANVTLWLAWMVCAVTGSLDRPGGMWFNPGYLTQTHRQTWAPRDGSAGPGPASRPELAQRFGELPCAAVVDEIEAGNLRALLVLGGNPLIAWPQPERVARALRKLNVLAVVDVIENGVTALATHVLPAAAQLERADIPTGAELYALQSFSQYTGRVVSPGAERRPTWWILGQLAGRLGLDVPGGPDPDAGTEEALLQALYGSDHARWQALRDTENAVVTEERPYDWVHGKMPDQRLRLAPELLVRELATMRETERGGLTLINRRQLRKNNSTLADGQGLARAARPETMLHPEDALEHGIADGDAIVISSAYGELRTRARIDERAIRGTVSAPHGFVEANAAALISSDEVDPATGMPIMTGVPVTVVRA